MRCKRCGAELQNAGGAEWLGIEMICRDCCGPTQDAQTPDKRSHYGGLPASSPSFRNFLFGKKARN